MHHFFRRYDTLLKGMENSSDIVQLLRDFEETLYQKQPVSEDKCHRVAVSCFSNHYCTLFKVIFSSFLLSLLSTCSATMYSQKESLILLLFLPLLHDFQCLIPPSIKFSSLTASFCSFSLYCSLSSQNLPKLLLPVHRSGCSDALCLRQHSCEGEKKRDWDGTKESEKETNSIAPILVCRQSLFQTNHIGCVQLHQCSSDLNKVFLSSLSIVSHHLGGTRNWKRSKHAQYYCQR